MKKLFTLAAAVLAALTMNAQSTAFLWQYDGSTTYGDGTNGIFDVAADASNGTVKFVTYEGKKTTADGTSAYDASVTDNDLKPNITKVCKLGNNGAHLRISPASGNFLAGDTLFICGYKDFIVSTSSDPTSTAKITSANEGATIIAAALATGSGKGACKVGYVVLPEGFAEANEIYISRANGTSAGVAAIKVVRPEQKTIVSTVETLTGVSANGVAMSADEFANLLLWNEAGFPDEEFPAAPTFVFYRNTVITYDDESTKEINDSIVVVGVEDEMGDWAASATIGGVEYSVYAGKAVSVTITYMDGETLLGTEVVAEADFAEDYVNYESKPLATFIGWFSDAECTTPVDLVNMPVYTDIIVYAKFEKAYLANSVNIEQLVLDNGKKYDIAGAFTAANIDFKNINDLDSLNDEKAARNEPYLGLKIKKQGGYIACNVQAGHTIRVKFGYVAADVKAYANGLELTLTPEGNALPVLEYPAAEETFVKLETTTDGTVVIKQIMIDEPIADVVLPDVPTGINNAEEAVKAVKVIRNGQLFIEKNGVLFNAQGAIVK